MSEVVNISKFCCAKEKLYFFSEEESVFGNIDLNTGKIAYSDSTPKCVLGNNAHNSFTLYNNEKLYSLADDGRIILEYDLHTDQFTEYNIEPFVNFCILGGLAGYFFSQGIIYAFPRENGKMLIFNTETKLSQVCETGIKEKIMWVCCNDDKAYILSWDRRFIYFLDLKNFAYEKFASGINSSDEINSNSIIPFHCIACDDNDIYFCDARRVYKFNINEKKLTIAYSSSYDIGCRIVVTNDHLIIPPWHKEEFNIIDKKNSEIIKTIQFPENFDCQQSINRNITGVPYKNESSIYIPVIASDVVLCIDMYSLDFSWISLVFDKGNIGKMVERVIASERIIMEAPDVALSDYLSGLLNVYRENIFASAEVGYKIHNLIKTLCKEITIG